MKQSTLLRYAPLYRLAQYYGADSILRRHLSVDADYVIPLGPFHGADFGGFRLPGDIHSIEPIYWACNANRHASARQYKESVAIPHPFLLAAGDHSAKGDRVLVIGPPPGKTNDERLLVELTRVGVSDATILVKPRAGWQRSIHFWESHKYQAISMGHSPSLTYTHMVELFTGYGHVVSPTMSSAAIFASALGSTLTVLQGYRYTAYELPAADHVMAWDSAEARDFVHILAGDDQPSKTRASRAILGQGLDWAPAVIREAVDQAIARLGSPFHFRRCYPRPVRQLLQEAALRLGRPGLIAVPLREWLTRKLNRRMGILEMNEFDFWLNGRNPSNYAFRLIPYVAGQTIPGDAPDPH